MKKLYNIQEGLDSLNRIKLLMGYDSKKTLTENTKSIISEDATNVINLSTADPTTKDDSDVYDSERGMIKTPNGWVYGGKKIEITYKITPENVGKTIWTDSKGNPGTFNSVPVDVKTKLINPPVVASYTNSVGDKISLHASEKNNSWSMVYYTVSSSGKKSDYNPRTQQDMDEHLGKGEVWDPECETDQQYMDSRGTHSRKVKTGCWVKLPSPDGKIDKNGKRIIGLRQDKYGNQVPYGYDVDDYNEYLSNIESINQSYQDCVKGINDNFNKRYQEYGKDHPSDFLGSGGQFEMGTKNSLQAGCASRRDNALKELKEKYYHEDFPYGIPHEDYQDFKETQSNNEKNKSKELEEFEKNHQCGYIKPYTDYDEYGKNPVKVPGGYYFDEDCLTNEELKQYEQIKYGYTTMDEFMYKVHQYDPTSIKEMNKSAIRKWWEKWSWAVELVGWIVLDMLTAGIAEWLGAARQAIVLKRALGNGEKIIFEVLPSLLKSTSIILPAGIGIADIIKEGKFTEEAAMWFLFAMLPFTHSPKLPTPPTAADCEAIIKLLRAYPMTTSENIATLFRSMTKEQKRIFRAVSRMNKQELEAFWKDGMNNVMKNVPQQERKKLINLIKGTTNKTMLGSKALNNKIWADNLVNGLKKGTFRISTEMIAIEGISATLKALGITKPGLAEELKKAFDEKIFSPNDYMSLMSELIGLIEKNPNLDSKGIVNKITTKKLKEGLTNSNMDKLYQLEGMIKVEYKDGTPVSDEDIMEFEREPSAEELSGN